MSGDQFQVTTATLRTVAGDLGRRADDAQQIADKAKDAEVATHSWGLLGLSLGLYAGYTSARNTAEHSIGEVTNFLQHAQKALGDTADAYDEIDAAGKKLFGTLDSAMSGGGS